MLQPQISCLRIVQVLQSLQLSNQQLQTQLLQVIAGVYLQRLQLRKLLCYIDEEVNIALLQVDFLDVHAVRDLLHIVLEFMDLLRSAL